MDSLALVPPATSQPQPIQPNKRIDFVHAGWATAPSLRPDTARLAEACMEGDKESIAIRDAYQFQTSRATRIVCASADHPMFSDALPLVFKLANSGVVELVIPTRDGLRELCDNDELSRAQEELAEQLASHHRSQRARSKPEAVKIGAEVVLLTPKEREKAIEVLLTQAMPVYNEKLRAYVVEPSLREKLWDALTAFAAMRSHAYKQASLREIDREGDLSADFVLHAMKQIDRRMYSGKGPFCHWIKKIYRTFADTKLKDLTAEKRKYFGLMPPDPTIDDAVVDVGYTSADGLAFDLAQRSNKELEGAEFINSKLRELSVEDQAYAERRKLGLNQQQAAEQMDESVVTSRKREKRIRAVLLKPTVIGKIQACAGEAEETEDFSASFDIQACAEDEEYENVVCIQACAEDDFEPLLGVPEAAKLLCLHPKTVQAMARAGTIPCTRIGKYWRFRASVLDVWVREAIESSHQSRRVA